MSLILKRGELPATPHTEFYALPRTLALEEIHGSLGFSGPYSRKMHLRAYPTVQRAPPKKADFQLLREEAGDFPLEPYHLRTWSIPYGRDFARARIPLLFGPHSVVSVVKASRSMPPGEFLRNGEKHELFYLQSGKAEFQSEYGSIPLLPKRYLVVPKGTTYRVELLSPKTFFLALESTWPIDFPPHYLNASGQARLSAPIVETEIVAPRLDAPKDERGRFPVHVQHEGGRVTRLTLDHHPFDLCGWEGSLYPFGFDILSHHALAREIHTAPPAHQTFQAGCAPTHGFSICSFVPQMEGWHPKDIPAPYAHYNVDSDEVMFFSNADYGARRGVIGEGSLTFHPGSLPHSPQGRAALRSRAERGKPNKRLAVMLDTFFESLRPTKAARRYRDPGYALSWWKTPGEEDSLHGT